MSRRADTILPYATIFRSLAADNTVATLFTAIFSVGVAIGSIVVNRLLKGRVSARYSPGSVIVMGLLVLDLWWSVNGWPHRDGMMNWREFLSLTAGARIDRKSTRLNSSP